MSIHSFYTPYSYTDADNTTIFVHQWSSENPHSILIIAHGMMEHGKRYAKLAAFLNEHGIAVFAPDHRGHGRTADETGLGILGQHAGWQDWVRNLGDVVLNAETSYPNIPIFILGHSMGSFITQAYASAPHPSVKGLILSGSTYEPCLTTWFGKHLAHLLSLFQKPDSSGKLLGLLSFFRFCKDIPEPKSVYDWLTRDDAVVTGYLNDPLCGHIPPNRFFYELFSMLHAIYKKNHFSQIPKTLPLFLYAGNKDPLSNHAKKVQYLANRYRLLGHSVTETYYPDGRHEMHNELNWEEVAHNILRWIKLHS